MEVTVNKDIRKIRETIFFGIPLRETVLSGLALIVGFITFMSLQEYIEAVQLVATVLTCSPLAIMCLFKYQGLRAERVAVEYLRSLFLPKVCVLEPENEYARALKPIVNKRKKEALKNDKISAKKRKREKRALQNAEKNAGFNTVE